MLAGETETSTIPVPLSETTWGLSPPVSFTVRFAGSDPNVAGVNVTVIVQLFPAPKVAGLTGQLLVCIYSGRLVAILLIVIRWFGRS